MGLSCLSGAHRYLFPRVVELLREQGADDITVIGGGIIPDQDFRASTTPGIKAIFTPGARLDAIVDWVRDKRQTAEIATWTKHRKRQNNSARSGPGMSGPPPG